MWVENRWWEVWVVNRNDSQPTCHMSCDSQSTRHMNNSQPTHHMNVLKEFAGVVKFVLSWEWKLELRFLQSN